jgi:hypothetical protein
VLWCDESWASKNLAYLNTLTCSKFYVKQNSKNYITKNLHGIANSTVLNKSGDFGIDFDIDNVRGNNSGAHAINFLVNCNVADIGLIGFDMQTTNNVHHFHNDYTFSIRPETYSKSFIPAMESMAKELNNKVKIFNCNELSALKCFEYKSLKDMLCQG